MLQRVLQLAVGNHDGLEEALLFIFVALALLSLFGVGTLFLSWRAIRRRDVKSARRLAWANALVAVGSISAFVVALPGPDASKLLVPAVIFSLVAVRTFTLR